MIEIIGRSLMITVFVFIMMIIVDYLNVLSKGRLSMLMRGGRLRQYTVASFLGATPGCLGSFLNVSFYVRGLLTFGAICGAMIATSGDEAFVMLAVFPKIALLLFAVLFVIGIASGWIIDQLAGLFKIVPCQECRLAPIHRDDDKCRCFDLAIWTDLSEIRPSRIILMIFIGVMLFLISIGSLGPPDWGWMRITLLILLSFGLFLTITVPNHYLNEHIWGHIFKEHIWRVFLWTLGALFFVHFGLDFFNLEGFIRSNIGFVFISSALIGIIPESGPHLIFVMMFSQGIVPFSVLLTSSIVQDGHGLLPLLSYSIKDSVLIKIFNLAFGLLIGLLIYSFGL